MIGVLLKVESPASIALEGLSNPVMIVSAIRPEYKDNTISCAPSVNLPLNTGRTPEVRRDCFSGGRNGNASGCVRLGLRAILSPATSKAVSEGRCFRVNIRNGLQYSRNAVVLLGFDSLLVQRPLRRCEPFTDVHSSQFDRKTIGSCCGSAI